MLKNHTLKIILISLLVVFLQSCSSHRHYRSSPVYTEFDKEDYPQLAKMSHYDRAMWYKNKYDDAKYSSRYSSNYRQTVEAGYNTNLRMAIDQDRDQRAYLHHVELKPGSKKSKKFLLKLLDNSTDRTILCRAIDAVVRSYSSRKAITLDEALKIHRVFNEQQCPQKSMKKSSSDDDYWLLSIEWLMSIAEREYKNSNEQSQDEMADKYAQAYTELENFVNRHAWQLARRQYWLPDWAPRAYNRWSRIADKVLDLMKYKLRKTTTTESVFKYRDLYINIINNLPQANRFASSSTKSHGSHFAIKSHEQAALYSKLLDFYNSVRMLINPKINQSDRRDMVIKTAYEVFKKANTGKERKSLMREAAFSLCVSSYHYDKKGGFVFHDKWSAQRMLTYCNTKQLQSRYNIGKFKRKKSFPMYIDFLAARKYKILHADDTLPDKVKKDKYQLKAAEYLKKRQYEMAQPYLEALIWLGNKKRIKISPVILYYAAKSNAEINVKYSAERYLNQYLNKTGSKGRFYKDALLLSDKLNQ